MLAFLFPGQGAQAVGMGRDIFEAFPEARDVLHEVDDTLSDKLSRVILEGPADELTRTDNAQPALMAVSMAIVRVLERAGYHLHEKAHCVAGHSLGEYTALTAVRMFDLASSATLLRIRGRAMNEAAPAGSAGMAALLGGDRDSAERLAAEAAQGQVCVLANDNSPEQHVISGHLSAIERAVAMAPQHGFKRGVVLPVSSAFHSPLMAPAQATMARALEQHPGQVPYVPVVANVTATFVQDPQHVRTLLVEQVVGQVRWCDSVRAIQAAGVTTCVEIGAGKVLSGLVKRIEPGLETITLNTPQDIESFLKRFA